LCLAHSGNSNARARELGNAYLAVVVGRSSLVVEICAVVDEAA
jgi:hypothetical protein